MSVSMNVRSEAGATVRRASPASLRARFERDVVALLGLPFDRVDLAGAVDKLRSAAFANTRCFVSTPNLNFSIAAREDAAFRDSVLCSDLSLADGAPVAWMARRMGVPLCRVAGSSVFEALRAHPGPPLTVFFFGGAPGVAEAASGRLNAAPGGLRCVGYDDAGTGSIDDMSTPARIDRINRSNAQFVVVSLGAKKGQRWIMRNAERLQAPLICHLGAVVNFVAGTVARAPTWVQNCGLEWLWRIKEEPELWRRYRDDGAMFLRLIARRLPQLASTPRSSGGGTASLEVERSGQGDLTLHLAGSWGDGDLAPVRDACAQAAAGAGTLTLSMARVASIDCRFVGLLMLAYGSLGVGRLRLLGLSRVLQSTVRDCGAEFLLDDASSRIEAAPRSRR